MTNRRTLLIGTAAAGVGLAVGGSAHGRPASASVREHRTTAIRHATLIDGTGRGPVRDATVLLCGDTIVAAGSHVPVPADATVIDGRGKFLIPGLADMHAHSSPLERTYPPLYIANGITTVREMAANPDISAFRDRVEAGMLLGPRWTIGSLIIDGSPSLWEGLGAPVYLSVGTPAEARAAVRDQQAAGAAFIKTYTRLTRESFLALAAESHRRGIRFLGHCPDFVPMAEASDAGLHTAEHLFQIWYDASSQEQRLRRQIASVPIGPGEYSGWFAKMHPIEYEAAKTYDRRKAARVYARLVRNGTAVTPTLTVHRTSDMPLDIPRDDPRYRYFPAELLAEWSGEVDFIYLKDLPPEQVATRREVFRRRLPLVRELYEAGVPLMAGTDTGTSYLMPGFSLHDELALLVEAGLSPMAAIQAATRTPAHYLGSNGGTIEPGRHADLVLLDADPLRDIRNTTRIDSLVVRGRYIGRAERRQMLDDVLAAAQQPMPAVTLARCAC